METFVEDDITSGACVHDKRRRSENDSFNSSVS